jgi:catechol 2,3-dioxygenase-like lactoylglutathione lyase family enzyme
MPACAGTIIFIYTRDMTASRAFYRNALELPVRSDQGAVIFFSLAGAGSSLGVVEQGISAATTPPCSAATAGRDTVMLCLLAEDVDGLTARLAARGHPVEQPPRENARFGIYNSLVRDPDGYLIELQTFLDPAVQRAFCGAGASHDLASLHDDIDGHAAPPLGDGEHAQRRPGPPPPPPLQPVSSRGSADSSG